MPVEAAESEISLVQRRYSKNDTSKVLWAIFEAGNNKAQSLTYTIRSSEIGENRMIMMHEEEALDEGKHIKIYFPLSLNSESLEISNSYESLILI